MTSTDLRDLATFCLELLAVLAAVTFLAVAHAIVTGTAPEDFLEFLLDRLADLWA